MLAVCHELMIPYMMTDLLIQLLIVLLKFVLKMSR